MLLLLPQTDLTDVDMEDDMKHIVSDEIRRFRQSYKVSHCTFTRPLHHVENILSICACVLYVCMYVYTYAYIYCDSVRCMWERDLSSTPTLTHLS